MNTFFDFIYACSGLQFFAFFVSLALVCGTITTIFGGLFGAISGVILAKKVEKK